MARYRNLTNQVRVEQRGREVHLIVLGDSNEQAESLCEDIAVKLRTGACTITIACDPAVGVTDAVGRF
jgi:hypothetical protein